MGAEPLGSLEGGAGGFSRDPATPRFPLPSRRGQPRRVRVPARGLVPGGKRGSPPGSPSGSPLPSPRSAGFRRCSSHLRLHEHPGAGASVPQPRNRTLLRLPTSPRPLGDRGAPKSSVREMRREEEASAGLRGPGRVRSQPRAPRGPGESALRVGCKRRARRTSVQGNSAAAFCLPKLSAGHRGD